jgi:hypothetical protein
MTSVSIDVLPRNLGLATFWTRCVTSIVCLRCFRKLVHASTSDTDKNCVTLRLIGDTVSRHP